VSVAHGLFAVILKCMLGSQLDLVPCFLRHLSEYFFWRKDSTKLSKNTVYTPSIKSKKCWESVLLLSRLDTY